MDPITITLIIALIICALGIIYCQLNILFLKFQMKRNDKVGDIRLYWIDSKDDRLNKYTYDFMFESSKHNWYGFRFPNEKHYKC